MIFSFLGKAFFNYGRGRLNWVNGLFMEQNFERHFKKSSFNLIFEGFEQQYIVLGLRQASI